MKKELLSKVMGMVKGFVPFYLITLLPLVGCTSADNVTKNTINQEEVMAKLSLEDKAHFVIGVGMAGFSGEESRAWCCWYYLSSGFTGHPCCGAG